MNQDTITIDAGRTPALFLDVATKYTGYATFEYRDKIQPATFVLKAYGIIKGGDHHWRERCLVISSKVRNMILGIQPCAFVMEFPSFHAGVKGMAAARSGGTMELAYLCGKLDMAWEQFVAFIMANTNKKIRLPMSDLVTFNEWGGQLTKEMTASRCKEHFGIDSNPSTIDNNFTDAIMMGRWYLEEKIRKLVSKSSAEAARTDV